MLRPIAKGKKRIGLLKVAHRASGKILEDEHGLRIMVLEYKGWDIRRGRFRTLSEAVENNAASIGVDRQLLTAAQKHNVSVILIVIEEHRKIFLAAIDDFFDAELCRTASDYRGRAIRCLPLTRFHQKYFAPDLHKRKKSATA